MRREVRTALCWSRFTVVGLVLSFPLVVGLTGCGGDPRSEMGSVQVESRGTDGGAAPPPPSAPVGERREAAEAGER